MIQSYNWPSAVVSFHVGECECKMPGEKCTSFLRNTHCALVAVPLTGNSVSHRLQRDLASHDDRATQVPSGKTRGPGGLLPAAQQYPGGAL